MARPMSFLAFVDRMAKLGGPSPEPGQRALLGVLFNGDEPADHGDLGVKIFGYERGTPARARDCAGLVVGARGGKTLWSGGYRCLHLALTVDCSRLAPGEHGYVFLVAPKLDLAQQALNYIKGIIALDPALGRISTCLADEIVIQRQGGRQVTIQCVAASRGGTGQRGRSLLGALLDETAFFRDETSGAVNDQHIYNALALRVIEGGQIIVQSTPWARTGLLYDLYKTNWGKPQSALVAHAPTLLLRTDEKIRAQVEREYARNPESARIDFGAEFGAASSTTWLDPQTLEASTSASSLPRIGPGDRLAAGGDLGFSRNSSALVIARRRPSGLIDFPVVEERRPVAGTPLRPSVVCQEFADILKNLGLETLHADRHYAETAREFVDLGEPPAPDVAWSAVRQQLRDSQLILPEHPLLLSQLKGVRGKLVAGGGARIELASTPDGRHSDLAAALALAVWALEHHAHEVPAARPRPGTPAHHQAVEDALEDAHERRVGRRQDAAWWDDAAANDTTSDPWSSVA